MFTCSRTALNAALSPIISRSANLGMTDSPFEVTYNFAAKRTASNVVSHFKNRSRLFIQQQMEAVRFQVHLFLPFASALFLEEREQIGVNLVRVGGGHAMRK